MSDESEQIDPPEPLTQEDVILTYLFANHGLFAQAAPILKPEYFSGVYEKAVQFALAHYHKHHTVPNRLLISAESGFLPEITTDHDAQDVVAYVSDSVQSFCRMKAVDQFLLKASDENGSDRSNAAMAKMFTEMQKITQISMARDLGSEFHADFEKHLAESKISTNISTGSPFFDLVLGGELNGKNEIIGGGLTRPSFNICSAETGGGKSIFLANKAVDYIRRHPEEDVVYYTLENSEAITYQRLAAIMTGLNIRTVFDHIDEVRNYVFRHGDKEGRLFIKRFPFRGTTMADIRAHFYDLRAQKSSRLRWFGVDYMDLMMPSVEVQIENIHVRDEQITAEMYDFCYGENLIGWTVAQQTKGSEEETEAKKGKVAGGKKKTDACDNLFILKRTDEDRINGRTWAHCKKCRSGPGIDSAIPIDWNRESQKMTDGDMLEFRRANPRLFGATIPASRVERDPVAAELGVSGPEPIRPTPAQGPRNIAHALINRIKARSQPA
jgi:replicative DNA helicase